MDFHTMIHTWNIMHPIIHDAMWHEISIITHVITYPEFGQTLSHTVTCGSIDWSALPTDGVKRVGTSRMILGFCHVLHLNCILGVKTVEGLWQGHSSFGAVVRWSSQQKVKKCSASPDMIFQKRVIWIWRK